MTCLRCKRDLNLDLQSIIMGVCGAGCAVAIGITDAESRLMFKIWDRLNPYLESFLRDKKLLQDLKQDLLNSLSIKGVT